MPERDSPPCSHLVAARCDTLACAAAVKPSMLARRRPQSAQQAWGRARVSCRHRREGGKAARRARAQVGVCAGGLGADRGACAARAGAVAHRQRRAEHRGGGGQAGGRRAGRRGRQVRAPGRFPDRARWCAAARARAQLAQPQPMGGASCRPAPRGRTVAGQGRAGPARTWQSLLPRPGQPHPSKARPGCAQRGSKVEAFFWVWGFPLALCARMRMRGGRRPWPRPRTRADPNRLVYPNVTPRQAGCWRAEAPTLRRRCSGTCGASTRAPPP